ncbi:hypothetical protein SRHO_G00222210 [Serrasalmus rhombeus]
MLRTWIGEMKAKFTSILKMDSTRDFFFSEEFFTCDSQVTKKLAGAATRTAAWVTMGNEYRQMLMSMLTAHEGHGLLPMAVGLMRRYNEAGVPLPNLLYVDRDCYSRTGRSRAVAMFHEWEELVVRLDVWHLM